MYAREESGKHRGRPPVASPSRDGAVNSAVSSMLNIQRTAGNARASRSLSGQGRQPALPVQRAGYDDEGYSTYGERDKERRRLERRYGKKIDGHSTHQAEHPIPYSAAAPRSVTGGARGAGALPKYVEKNLPAYYEDHDSHRAHPGTGTRKQYGDTPMTQDEYREAHRTALKRNNPAAALHTTAVEYAGINSLRDDRDADYKKRHGKSNPFRDQPSGPAYDQAESSYQSMINNLGKVPYLDDQGQLQHTRSLVGSERAELIAGRDTSRTGKYPDLAEQDRYLRRQGTHRHETRSTRDVDLRELSPGPQPLDTSYYRERSSSRSGESQRDALRRLAKTPYRPDPGAANAYDSDGYLPGPSPLRRSSSVSGRSHAPSDRSSRPSSYYPPVSTSGRYPPSSSRSRDIDPYASGSGTGGLSRSSLRRSNSVSASRPSSSQVSYVSDYEDEPVFSQSSSFRAPSLSRSSSRRDRDRDTRYY